MALFPAVFFYDYTLNEARALEFAAGKLPSNYSLTFSRKEDNDAAVSRVAAAGVNVAVVFASNAFPENYIGRPIFNGDNSDLRFLDPKGVIVALKAKRKARKDTSGFVVQGAGN